ncbi:MAG: hypothetical protein SVY10_01960 [Thermodesulfobacteriota bacterium]|nr:hypothetical protein [Thermodesulfobacteriota bacterium]
MSQEDIAVQKLQEEFPDSIMNVSVFRDETTVIVKMAINQITATLTRAIKAIAEKKEG